MIHRTPRHGDREEPDHHDWAEQVPDTVRAVFLDGEHADQNRDGDRHHIRLEQWRRHVQPFDSAEHGDRRRDHAIPVQQCGPEDPEQNEQRAAGPIAVLRRDQGREREDAALALIVGAHDHHDVFHRDDDQQRVDDQRQDAENVFRSGRDGVRSEEALAQRIERARADVAIDDADGGQGQDESVMTGGGGLRQGAYESSIPSNRIRKA